MDFSKYITLDWDANQVKFIKLRKNKIAENIFLICENIKVYEGQKGINLIIKLNKEISLQSNIISRINLGDDLFRVRADCEKGQYGEMERINRIFLIKNDYVKKLILMKNNPTIEEIKEIIDFYINKSEKEDNKQEVL